MPLKRIALPAFLLALTPAGALAQSITGTVYDPTGGIVPDARVVLLQEYSKLQETKSGPAGNFSFTGLKPGMYQLQIKQPKFWLFQNTVILNGSEEAHIYAVLPLARALDSIVIKGRLAPGGKRAVLAEKARRRGGNIQVGSLAHFRPPKYPEDTQASGIEGPVVLHALIKPDGTVGDVVVIESPHYTLEEEALQAVRQWRYQPTKLNGQPVETYCTIVLTFRLQ